MYKTYFKQAWQMLGQNKFMSVVSIVGTSLAIMMVMIILVTDEMKKVSVAPEINRYRTYYITQQLIKDTVNNHWNSGPLEKSTIQNYLLDLKTPEYISIVNEIWRDDTDLCTREGMPDFLNTHVRNVDSNYWKLFSFKFIEGKPFSRESVESGLYETVISQTLSRKLFRGESPLGQTILINMAPYRVVGVVKDISPLFKQTSGDAWVPYTTMSRWAYNVMIILWDQKDYPALVEEIRQKEKIYSIKNPNKILTLNGPDNHRIQSMNITEYEENEISKQIHTQYRKRIFILLILLLVPAVNLSGLSLSRIKKRQEEIGIRKAFGAKRYIIIIQVLCENMITSLIGGVIGLIFSYLAIFQLRDWLLNIPSDQMIPVNTLISIPVLLSVILVCITINLLSAGIPAYKASTAPIVQSLTQNEKDQ